MYSNIEMLIFKRKLSKKLIAEKLGITYRTLLLKLNGKASFTLNEAMKLKEILNTELSIEELFDRDKVA